MYIIHYIIFKVVLSVVFIFSLHMCREPCFLEYMCNAFIIGTCYCYYEKKTLPKTKWIKNNTLLWFPMALTKYLEMAILRPYPV